MKPVRQSMQSDNYDPTILTHPNIPKPLHGVNPRTIMGEEMWKELSCLLRKDVMFCQACGTSKFISGAFDCHEVYRFNCRAGIARFVKFVVICKDCHDFIHDGRLQAIIDKMVKDRETSYKVWQSQVNRWRIIDRGNKILEKHKLKRKNLCLVSNVGWSSWKLIYQGKEYKPIYKSMKEWRAAYE